jgi:hypothetical protein
MLSKIAIVFLFCLSFRAFAHDSFLQEMKPKENLCRMKVNLSDLFIQEDGMYLRRDQHCIQILELQFENGSYTATAPMGIAEDVFGMWWCYNCQHWNSKFRDNCFYCGKSRGR